MSNISKGVNSNTLRCGLDSGDTIDYLILFKQNQNYNIHIRLKYTPASDMVCSHAAASRSRLARARPVITRAWRSTVPIIRSTALRATGLWCQAETWAVLQDCRSKASCFNGGQSSDTRLLFKITRTMRGTYTVRLNVM